MLVKCETKSNRVKGLSFHPKLSWILASLHNGVIQLWDYRIGSLIDKFEEHEGPVRGVDFHSSQPLFVSGGDDYRLKVWNYRTRKCIFTLIGHLDYIRTVQFHSNYPWIISASDDQTIRIWNWQSRNCIAVLTGHNHYVMSAQFHPNEDYLVSGSLDQTIRIWDVSGLREKTVSLSSSSVSSSSGNAITTGGINGVGIKSSLTSQHSSSHVDMFGTSDCICKYILEGHDRGVNWVTFHPTLPLVASAADDRLIKLWRYNDIKAWEVDSLRGHFNNVSCVIFHPHKDVLISNSEDRTIRVWDTSKRIALHTFRRDNDRFWILTAHLNSNLIGVGHDSGMVVFKLDRERPPMHCQGNMLFHIKDKYIQLHDCNIDLSDTSSLSSLSSVSISPVRRALNALNGNAKCLMYNTMNTAEINLIVHYNEALEGSSGISYDIITCPNPQNGAINSSLVITKTGGNCGGIVFSSRNRVCVLDKSSATLCVYTLNLELTKRIEPPFQVEAILSAYNNRVILKCDEKAVLYDLMSRKIIGEVSCPGGLRYSIWSNDFQFVALLAKHHVTLANQKFDYIFSFHENIRVKSGAWDEHGAFIYATLSHVKYCLQNGDQGIIHSLIDPIYICRVNKQKMTYINRKMDVCEEELNGNEYLFKLALQKKQFDLVNMLIKNGRLCGNAVIGYLKRNGYAEVAMKFVDNPKTKFNLALDFGHLHHAIQAAHVLDDPSMWERLGKVSLNQGNYQMVETSYQKIKSFEKLSFLYLISGNFNKLKKMLKIAELRKDVMSRFHNALMLGDVEERVRILAEVGQLPLAYLTAQVHKVEEVANALKEFAQNVETESVIPKHPKLLIPPIVINGALNSESANWPMKNIQNVLDGASKTVYKTSDMLSSLSVDKSNVRKMMNGNVNADLSDEEGVLEGSGWDDEIMEENEYNENNIISSELNHISKSNNQKQKGLWASDSIDDFLSSDSCKAYDTLEMNGKTADIERISRGEKPENIWLKNQPLVFDFIAAGDFREALQVLHRRIGIINSEPLKKVFMHIYLSIWGSLPSLPQLPSHLFPLLYKNNKVIDKMHKPYRLYDCKTFGDKIKVAYKYVTDGRFNDALDYFRETLQFLAIAVCNTIDEEKTLREYMSTCREYVTAMRIESERAKLTSDKEIARNIELVSYFTCCKMLPSHLFLVLRRAMAVAYKADNFITTASFARRLIEGNFGSSRAAEEEIVRAKKVLLYAESKGTDAHDIDFDPNDYGTLQICSASFTRIRPGEATVKCAFCETLVKKAFARQICPTCDISELGARVLGMQFRPVT